jgi:hypothetical protein
MFALNDFAELTQVIEDFCAFIESLPRQSLKGKTWGVQSILAHLVYYHELYVRQAQAFLDGKPVKLFQGSYNELNAQIVRDYRKIPVSKLVRRLRTANQRLGKIYAACDPKLVIVPIKESVQPHRLDKLVKAVTGHVRNHQRQIKRDLPSDGKSD